MTQHELTRAALAHFDIWIELAEPQRSPWLATLSFEPRPGKPKARRPIGASTPRFATGASLFRLALPVGQ